MAGFALLQRRRLRLRAKARALESKLERSSLSDSHAASYATSLSTASENSDSSLKALQADVEQLREDYGTLCDCLRAKGVLTNEDLVEQGSRRLQAAAFQSLCRSPAAVRVVAEALGPAVAALSATSPCAASACRSTFLMEPAEQEKPQELPHREDEEAATPARRSVSTAEALEKVPGTTAVSRKSALSSRLLAHLIGVMWRAEERERPASIALHLKEVVRNLGHLAGATTAFKLSELCRCTADALRPVLPLISKEAPSIYVCGGSCGIAMDSAERFNPRTNQWEMLPSMCMPRRACAAASAGGKFYVLGGVDVPRFGGLEETQQEWMFQDKYCPECFDPVLNQWELLPPMNRPYTHAAATALGGFIYVFGGLSFGHVLDQAQRFDPNRGQWECLEPMPTPRFECTAVASKGRIYVLGGSNICGEPLGAVECYEPSSGQWKQLPEMRQARYGCAAASLRGLVYIFGGHGFWENLNDAECFDMEYERWYPLPPMPAPRTHCGAAVAGGSIYVFGGHTNGQDVLTIDCLNPESGSWEVVAHMLKPRSHCLTVTVLP